MIIFRLHSIHSLRLSCTVAYTGVDKWIKSWPSQPASSSPSQPAAASSSAPPGPPQPPGPPPGPGPSPSEPTEVRSAAFCYLVSPARLTDKLSGHAQDEVRASRAVRYLDGARRRQTLLDCYVLLVPRKLCPGPRIRLLLRKDPGLRHSLVLEHVMMTCVVYLSFSLFIFPNTRAEEAA